MTSVVVPARDAAATLAETLSGLAAQDHRGNWELIVVDDGSRDGTAGVARGWSDRMAAPVRVIDGAGRGPGAARNLGAAESAGDFLAFCDADDVPEPRWLSELAANAGRGEFVAGALHLSALNADELLDAHPPACLDSPVTGLGFMPFASSGNCGIWRDVFVLAGGFDEGFGAGEDMDLSWRLQMAGARLAFAERAVVQRRLRATPAAIARQHVRWGHANARLYARFCSLGMPPPNLARARREWGSVLLGIPGAGLSRRKRVRWAQRAGLRTGHLVGSVRHGVLYP